MLSRSTLVTTAVSAAAMAGLAGLAGLTGPAARPATTPAAAPAAQSAPAGVTLAAVGDTILGNTPTLPAHPRHYFAAVARSMRHGADVVFGNLEGTLTNQTASKCDGSSSGDCFAFRNPPAFAQAFADVGFTVLNDANNHSHDFGSAGLAETRSSIAHAGMHHTGMPGEFAVVRVHGLRVAVVGFAPYANTADMLDLDAADKLVVKAQRRADLVVVYMHAGAEGSDEGHVTGREEYYLGEDRGNARRFAHHVIRAGADLVIGSGPHVLRGMEFYRHRLIAYSLGNFANYRNFSSAGVLADSAILRVTLGPRGGFRAGQLLSVRLVDAGRPDLGGDSVGFVRRLSKDDFGAHAARLSARGDITPPDPQRS